MKKALLIIDLQNNRDLLHQIAPRALSTWVALPPSNQALAKA